MHNARWYYRGYWCFYARARIIDLLVAIDLRACGDDERDFVSFRPTEQEQQKALNLQNTLMDESVFCFMRSPENIIITPPLCISAR